VDFLFLPLELNVKEWGVRNSGEPREEESLSPPDRLDITSSASPSPDDIFLFPYLASSEY